MNLACLIILILILNLVGSTTVSSNIDVSDTFTSSGNPYQFTSSVVINADVVLKVESGVVMEFCDGCGISVIGSLVIEGTASQRVTLTPSGTYWGGLTINNYTSIRYAEFVSCDQALDFNTPYEDILIEDVNFYGSRSSLTKYDRYIYMDYIGTVEFRSCTFSFLTLSIFYAPKANHFILNNCTIEHNQNSEYMWYMYDGTSGQAVGTIQNCLFQNNTGDFAIYERDVELYMQDSTFQDNVFQLYFLYAGFYGDFFLERNLFQGNSFPGNPGKFFYNIFDVINFQLHENEFYDNTFFTDFFYFSGPTWNMTNNIFEGNSALDGSIIYFNKKCCGNFLVEGNNFTNNDATDYIFWFVEVEDGNTFQYNIFDNPDVSYEIALGGTGDAFTDVSKNWWGYTEAANVSSRIMDFYQDGSLKVAIFSPFIDQYFNTSSLKYDTGENEVISSDTTWTLAGSPYSIPKGLMINADCTLTIEAGVVVNIGSGAGMLAMGNIVANGNETHRIELTGPGWSGITISNDSSLSYVDFVGADYGISLQEPAIDTHLFEYCRFIGTFHSLDADSRYLDIYKVETLTFNGCEFSGIENIVYFGSYVSDVGFYNCSFTDCHGGDNFYKHDSFSKDGGNDAIETFDNCLFRNISCLYFVIVTERTELLTINECVFQDCVSWYLVRTEYTPSVVIMQNSLVERCIADQSMINSEFASTCSFILIGNEFYDSESTQTQFIRNRCTGTFEMTDNIFSRNSAGGSSFIFVENSVSPSFEIMNNNFTDNTGDGDYFMEMYDAVDFLNFHNNILSNPDFDYELYLGNDGDSSIDATINWWGFEDAGNVSSRIMDFFKDSSLKVVYFSPFINEYFNTSALSYETGDNNLITTDVVWTIAGSPYESNTILIDSSGSLTIEPGVVVKLSAGSGILAVGNLTAVGNSSHGRVRFEGPSWGGISVYSSGTQISHAEFVGANLGLSVVDYPYEFVLDDCLFTQNDENVDPSTRYINFNNVKNVRIENCEFSHLHNEILYFDYIDEVVMDNCEFKHNSGGDTLFTCQEFIYETGSYIKCSFSNCLFENNTDFEYLSYNWHSSKFEYTDSTFRNNHARSILFHNGGFATQTVERCLFEGNVITGGASGGILFRNDFFTQGATIANNEFYNNYADCYVDFGSASYTFNFSHNVFMNNEGGRCIDGDYLFNIKEGISVIQNNHFINNNASALSLFFLKKSLVGTKVTMNDFVNPNITYEIELGELGETDIDCTMNWWGTSNETLVVERFFDFEKDFNKKLLQYDPFLAESVDDYLAWDCYGEDYRDEGIVCSGHGDCTYPNYCNCDTGYTGEDCCCKSFFEFQTGSLLTKPYTQPEYSCDLPTTKFSSRTSHLGFSFRNFHSYTFGGVGLDKNLNEGYLNDVWRLSETNNMWCFVSGSDEINVTSSDYSDLGVLQYSPNNVISSRSRCSGFSSPLSFFVLFGSAFFGGVGPLETNEVWEFSVAQHEWRILYEHRYDVSTLPLQPSRRSGACAAELDSYSSYFFGGLETLVEDPRIIRMNNDLWKFDSISNEFVVIDNGTLGTNSSVSQADVIGYDTLTPLSPSDPPYHRAYSSCWVGSEKNLVFVFSGLLLDLSSSTNDLWIYNISQSQWSYLMGGNVNETNSIQSYYDYDALNLPSIRTGSIFFSNQVEFGISSHERLFFGGLNYVEGSTTADMWSFSSILLQFKFVNGTTPLENHENRSLFDIGSRGFGVGITKKDKGLIIIGGERGI